MKIQQKYYSKIKKGFCFNNKSNNNNRLRNKKQNNKTNNNNNNKNKANNYFTFTINIININLYFVHLCAILIFKFNFFLNFLINKNKKYITHHFFAFSFSYFV